MHMRSPPAGACALIILFVPGDGMQCGVEGPQRGVVAERAPAQGCAAAAAGHVGRPRLNRARRVGRARRRRGDLDRAVSDPGSPCPAVPGCGRPGCGWPCRARSGCELAGYELAGCESAGWELAGWELAGSELAGCESAGCESAGPELASCELAGWLSTSIAAGGDCAAVAPGRSAGECPASG
jgi:hypothetical protein